MRTIKFRGYSDELKSFVYGFYQEVNVNGVIYSYIFWQGNTTHVRTDSVCQFTGLHDKNGKEIYEGDILVKSNRSGWDLENFVAHEVFFHDNDMCESSIGFQMNRHHFQGSICGTNEYYKFIPKNTKQFEVIGNVFENPELVKL